MSAAQIERQEARAVAKWVRISPRKARLVIDHIRGRPVPEARTVLAFTTRAAAREIEKVLRSAVANAEMNHGLVGDDLVVSDAYVDDGLIIKRWKPRARGRVARIQKRTCHITIKLAPADGAAATEALPETVPASEEAGEPAAESRSPESESAGAPTPEEQLAVQREEATPSGAGAATGSASGSEPAEGEGPNRQAPKRKPPRRERKTEEEES